MDGLDVILNRNARRLRPGSPLGDTLARVARRYGARVHETGSLAELARAADQIAARGTSGVVLAGGDGSHMAGATALFRAFGGAPPPMGLAPAGTVGTIARNLGGPGATRTAAERLLDACCAGRATPVTQASLRVRDDAGGDRVGFIFGAGLVARFFEVYARSARPGRWAAAHIAGRAFAGSFVGSAFARRLLEPTLCTLVVDGVAQAAPGWSLVVASVVRDLGLHLLVTYRAGASLDRFHAVASGLPPRALGPQMLQALRGLALRGEPRVDALARSLRLRFEAPLGPYVLDGETLVAGEISVEAGPTLSLLVAAPARSRQQRNPAS